MSPVYKAFVPASPPARPPYPPAPNPYLRSPLPANQVWEPDTLRQFYRAGTQQTRIVPMQAAGNPAINASSQNVVASALRTGVSISLSAPKEIIVHGSPAGATGGFVLLWAPELFGTVFAGPNNANNLGIPQLDSSVSAAGNDTSTVIAISNTPQFQVGEWAVWLYAAPTNGPVSPPTGWTQLLTGGLSTENAYGLPLNNLGTVSINQSLVGASVYATALAIFNSQPTIVQQNTVNINGGGTLVANVTLPSPVTAGNTILVFCLGAEQFVGQTFPPFSPGTQAVTSVTDTANSKWSKFANAFTNDGFTGGGTKTGASAQGFIATNVVAGSDTVTLTATVCFSAGMTAQVWVLETTPMLPLKGVPGFRKLVGADLPLPSTTTLGAVFSIAPVTHQFLTGLASTGIFSAAQPAFTDISGNIAVTQMNSGTNASATTFFSGDGTWKNANASAPIVTKTASYTLTSADYVVLMNSTSATTVTALATVGVWRIKNINTGVVTISLSGKTIDGQTSTQLAAQNQSVDISYDGTNFDIQ
jgi:hypothetical protein